MEKVRTGQPFTPRAADWNSFIDAANFVRNHEQTENFSSKLDTVTGIVTVKNVTQKDWPIYSCLFLSDLAVFPESSDSPNAYFFQPIVFAVSNQPDQYVPSNSKVCILQEPIPAGAIGKAMAIGVTHGKVNIKASGNTVIDFFKQLFSGVSVKLHKHTFLSCLSRIDHRHLGHFYLNMPGNKRPCDSIIVGIILADDSLRAFLVIAFHRRSLPLYVYPVLYRSRRFMAVRRLLA